jgi:cysteinyl-tRNA synthetase
LISLTVEIFMAIKIHNTLTEQKDEFIPIKKGQVGIYNCGPTVYDRAHIGNFRTFVLDDIIRRVFESEGYIVTQVMNSTDVDDKTIKKSQEEKKSLLELTRHYETIFLGELHSLNILTPHRFLRATEHIKEMVEMIANLLEKGIAYPTRDGVYFSIGKFPGYGKIAHINLEAEVRERISNDEYEKENPRDFALWKFYTPEDGEAVWDAPFGKGRPGWSIECSAMANWALGPTIDIHTGGIDLLFPHHTNEIAQSEAANGHSFARYWIHGAFVNVNEEKMAKSKGNFLKLNDLAEEGISPLAYRYWLLTSHYRTQINFTLDAVRGAQNAFVRLVEAFIDFSTTEHIHDDHHHHHAQVAEPINYKDDFRTFVTDDFNTPEAFALIWKLIKDPSIEPKEKSDLMLHFDKVLGLGLEAVLEMTKQEAEEGLPAEVNALVSAREEAREAKEWEKADALRKEIEARGYVVKDTDEGPTVRKS